MFRYCFYCVELQKHRFFVDGADEQLRVKYVKGNDFVCANFVQYANQLPQSEGSNVSATSLTDCAVTCHRGNYDAFTFIGNQCEVYQGEPPGSILLNTQSGKTTYAFRNTSITPSDNNLIPSTYVNDTSSYIFIGYRNQSNAAIHVVCMYTTVSSSPSLTNTTSFTYGISR
jgi:hypothetical protein